MSHLPRTRLTRRQRRWVNRLVVVLAAAVVVLLLIVLFPGGKKEPDTLTTGAPQTVPNRPTVPLRAADKREINRVLDRFVPAAVGRRNPVRAWALAASELRLGTTRAEWARGDVPVQPYPVRNGPTHEWVVLYSFPNVASLELGVHPRAHAKVGNAAFFVTMKRVHGRWLVSAIALHAVYPPATGS